MYGKRLRELRKSRYWTMDYVCSQIGIAKSSYAGYESQTRQPPIDKCLKLASLYMVSVDYILGLTEAPDTGPLDLREILNRNDLHYGGTPLSQEELKPFREILEMLAKKKQ
ncbi:helix-turn-helix domain-containing protein [Pseudalkalibacillus caeni]|uniref:Helix-turn-helix transcriptional regulator n=1 Tax=Exobacillus caeni TaxID=2574798 RepID=A0A5R9F796_9BACL|nr:helix-turn-helix transcriptional regulator [Pseudalkalibacillus caeni]TLS38911.1 helix-turn-helix transcriptional regulator [Pseudalkalibacillus caeni]